MANVFKPLLGGFQRLLSPSKKSPENSSSIVNLLSSDEDEDYVLPHKENVAPVGDGPWGRDRALVHLEKQQAAQSADDFMIEDSEGEEVKTTSSPFPRLAMGGDSSRPLSPNPILFSPRGHANTLHTLPGTVPNTLYALPSGEIVPYGPCRSPSSTFRVFGAQQAGASGAPLAGASAVGSGAAAAQGGYAVLSPHGDVNFADFGRTVGNLANLGGRQVAVKAGGVKRKVWSEDE